MINNGQLTNPKLQYGVRKPCFSHLPLAVLVPLAAIDLDVWERGKTTISQYVDAAIYHIILYADFHIDTDKEGVHPMFRVTVILMRLMHRILEGTIVDDRKPMPKLDFAECCKMQETLLSKYEGKKHADPFLANLPTVTMCADDGIPRMTALPMDVLTLMAVGMQEGAIKYGDHNYRCPDYKILVSTYVDATMRHIVQFFTFHEDIDAESKLHHIVKSCTSQVVLCDSIYNSANLIDDRPIPCKPFINK